MRTTKQQLIYLLGAASLCSTGVGAFHVSPSASAIVVGSSSRVSSSPSSRTERTTTALFSSPAPAAPSTKLKKKELRTLQRFLEVECWKNPENRDLERTFMAVADACKQINRIVLRAKTDDLYGAAVDPATGQVLEENVQGEVQQQLDVLCNTLVLRAFCSNPSVGAVASEEEPDPRASSDVMGYDLAGGEKALTVGEYVATFDPIDGSKNIDASLPVGTIFGIYKCPGGVNVEEGKLLDNFMRRGNDMVAAGYCLYSATTILVITMGNGVHGFTLDPDKQTFLQTHPNMKIPDVGGIYSFNEAYFDSYPPAVQKFLENMSSQDKMGGKPVSSRHIGAMVGDVHNVLINGGIYGYPGTASNPNGKLRLMYEGAPMAMIMEQAGGAGSTGYGRILDVLPEKSTGIHVRVPTFLGSSENVFELEQFFKAEEK